MKIDNWLEGHWALVLGASSGFGAEVSEALSEYGVNIIGVHLDRKGTCLLYTSPSPRDGLLSRMPSSA